ncbi:protein kinase domain-containing protein [Halalkalibacillus halophilus]|uniref:protein kinase domain-containing protein n=1 Tax=Halalkalibacillus halophilus TaxID=392827 RepID=UPI00041C4E27|nr:protein kinase [Halalkalibacillus halophilus]
MDLDQLSVPLKKGTQIKGKWNHQTYIIDRKLGQGARGTTYLAFHNHKRMALKISKDPSVVSKESYILKQINKVQGMKLGPYLFDVDDCLFNDGTNYAFYTMEWVQGDSVHQLLKNKFPFNLSNIAKQLLEQLHELHKLGYVYGDLKLENILLESTSQNVSLVDVGGVTKFGRSVREYSPVYDRGYWKKGSRKSEESYDLFSLAICLLQLANSGLFDSAVKRKDLAHYFSRSTIPKPFLTLLKQVTEGKYTRANQVIVAWEQAERRLKTHRHVENVSGRFKEIGILSTFVGVNGLLLWLLL